jgi:hypothetical protein
MVRPTSRADLLMTSLSVFYKQPENFKVLFDLISGKSKISLRMIDFVTTTYARVHEVTYPVAPDEAPTDQHEPDPEAGTLPVACSRPALFMVHSAYKAALKSYSKKNFDPFRRGENITLEYNTSGDYIVTSIGQMNIVQWLITNKVLSYITEHFDDINGEIGSLNRKIAEAREDEKKPAIATASPEPAQAVEEDRPAPFPLRGGREAPFFADAIPLDASDEDKACEADPVATRGAGAESMLPKPGAPPHKRVSRRPTTIATRRISRHNVKVNVRFL